MSAYVHYKNKKRLGRKKNEQMTAESIHFVRCNLHGHFGILAFILI